MNFLNLSCDILWSVGVFSSSGSSKWTRFIYNVYRVVILFFLITTIVLMTIQLFVALDLSLIARTVDIWTLFLSGTYKWFYIIKFSDKFAKLNKDLIKIHVQGAVIFGKTANQFTENYLKRMRPTTILYVFSGFVTAGLTLVNPLIAFPKSDRPDFDYFNDPKSYPFSYWIPFVIKDYWMFYAFYICHCISAFFIVLIYLGIDSFMFSAIYTIAGQIELLNSSIKTIKKSVASSEFDNTYHVKNQKPMEITYLTKNEQKICFSVLRECSKHHILVHKYIKKISADFSSLIIVDYLHGITSMTFALFQLSYNAGGPSETMAIMFYIFISGFHQFLNNYFGEFIVQKQLSVGFIAYDVPWWRLDKKSCYLLRLMILRSNNPTLITGFYMYKLCNSSFITFVKALYSYYMVLRRFKAGN